jgi:hypothetical protein
VEQRRSGAVLLKVAFKTQIFPSDLMLAWFFASLIALVIVDLLGVPLAQPGNGALDR